MSQGFSLKDQLFNAEKLAYLGGLFSEASTSFDARSFQAEVMAELPKLELRQRISWIAEVLHRYLPNEQRAAFDLIQAALPTPCDPTLSDDDFGDFIFAPLGELVVKRGLETPITALPLLAEITQRFSMEFAIRPFLNRWPDQVMEQMQDWSGHHHYHVRRLVSEGTRPKLPWGIKIGIDPLAPLPLLDRLQNDPTRFVTRSVANHLNDLGKIDRCAMLDRLETWQNSSAQTEKERKWITRHALRSLIKAGDARALALLGYRSDVAIEAELRVAPNPLKIGDDMALTATLRATQDLPVLVDYVMWFHRPNGREDRKVFKWTQTKLQAGQPLQLTKSRNLKAGASTFTLHPGPHRLGLQVNGQIVAEIQVELT